MPLQEFGKTNDPKKKHTMYELNIKGQRLREELRLYHNQSPEHLGDPGSNVNIVFLSINEYGHFCYFSCELCAQD